MPPYEEKVVSHIFSTIGLSDSRISEYIINWFTDVIGSTHFDGYDYTISVGRDLIDYVIRIFERPWLSLPHMLDKARIAKLANEDPFSRETIRIHWRQPVYREDGFSISKIYFDDIFRGITYLPTIKKVIYNNPATIIFWADGTKTVVQCQEGDSYDPEKGLAMAIAKKALGNTSRKLNDVLHKWEKKEEPSERHGCSNCKYNDQKLSKEPCKSCDPSFWSNWEAEE